MLLGVDNDASKESITISVIQKKKRALIQELELEDGWSESIGFQIDKSRALGICDDLLDEQKRDFHWIVFKDWPLCYFLQYGDIRLFWRVLTKDSPENRSFFGEGVKVVVEVVVDPQRQIDHFDDLGDDLRAAAEPCEKVADVAVVLFDGDGQVFAGEELVIRDEAVITLPIIGDERLAFEADFVEELLACGVITATKNPGDGSPSNRVIGSPKPQFLSLFFTKCHISSRVTTTTSALVDGSGSLRASSRTQFRTATSLTPRMRAMEPKLTLPMA